MSRARAVGHGGHDVRRVVDDAHAVHEVSTPHTPEPHVALLGGNGYNVLLTNAGSGYSRANEIDVLRWRADGTRDDTGHWIYIKDLTAATVWSAAYQPVCVMPSIVSRSFATDRVVFVRRDGAVETRHRNRGRRQRAGRGASRDARQPFSH